MRLRIITPESIVFEDDDVVHVQLPADNGELGILARHAPMVCSLAVGRIRVDLPGEALELATSGGYVHVVADDVTVLAETAEPAEQIDVERARRAAERAEQQLERTAERVEIGAAEAALRRAINRLKVAGAE